jgi:hypothetical protein
VDAPDEELRGIVQPERAPGRRVLIVLFLISFGGIEPRFHDRLA